MNKQKTIADLNIKMKFDCDGKTRDKFTFDDHLEWDNSDAKFLKLKIIPNRYKFRIFLMNPETYTHEWYEFCIVTVKNETLIDLLYIINRNISDITTETTGFGMYLEKFNQVEENTFEIELGIPF